MRVLSTLALLACGLSAASAAITLTPAVSSHMVLQRGGSAVVWGWTDQVGGDVQVTLNSGSSQTVQASAYDGKWQADVGKQAASAGNSITIADGKDRVQLTDVAFGDVVLCSGQSNMQFGVAGAFDNATEIADSVNYPNLRLFTVASNTSDVPLDTLAAFGPVQSWQVSAPSVFNPRDAWAPFSATCYFAGRDLYKSLGGEIPIGLVASYWGGTPVEAWSSPDALAKCPSSRSISEIASAAAPEEALDLENGADSEEAALGLLGGPNPGNPSVLWNAMIHPLLPMRFHMAMWYQGEANAGNPTSYACRFPAMIADWRVKFGVPLPFFFVQLAGYAPGGRNWPAQQIAQTAALALPQTGMATAMDLADPTSPEGDIHPRRKQQVGARLALAAGHVVYGQDAVYTGPLPIKVEHGTVTNNVVITLQGGTSSAGMYLNGTAACTTCCERWSQPFVALTRGGAQLNTSAVYIEQNSNQIRVETNPPPAGDSIVTLLYAYEAQPQCALYNSAGLPMTVFQIGVVQSNKRHTVTLTE